MPSLQAYVVTTFVFEFVPGPSTAYLAALTLTRGREAGVAAILGLTLGQALVGVLAATGLAALIDRNPVALDVLSWAGVVFLLWLAVRAWRDGQRAGAVETRPGEGGEGLPPVPRLSARQHFADGVLANALNPKAAVFYLAVMPTFIDRAWHPLVVQNLVLVVIYLGVAALLHLSVLIFASQIGRVMGGRHAERKMHRLMALCMLAIALWFLWKMQS
ncbi:LysE family translocator [Ancylobacter lacus]|uniref:LysE family translocator n=1 Tax=Ancylobacter lacus TaxID=2579970 RepID=UPI001BCD2650|nr:LysE family translocator [Ancylobacter lacus]MBS7540705.1 LysE family translocator [Ancylobacter lacus]